jgi:hypothetical protein
VLCGESSRQNQDRARLRGLNISSGEGIKGDVNFCIKEQLSNLEREYKVFLSLQKSKLSKDALTDHYVAAVLVVKGL